MKCYICDNNLKLWEGWEKEEKPTCLDCLFAIEEAIDRDSIEEKNDNRPV